MQMGQSPVCVLSGCLNNSSSRHSAARFLHASSCCDLWISWQSSLQYRTRSQPSHSFNLMSSTSAMPHDAQQEDDEVPTASSFSSPSLILFKLLPCPDDAHHVSITLINTRLQSIFCSLLAYLAFPISLLHQPDIYLHAGFVSNSSYFTTRNYTLFIFAKTR